MTVQGAIDCLSDKYDCRYCDHKSENCRKDAENIAIKSLESWDAVLEEIKEYDFPISYSEYMSADDVVKTSRNQMYSMFLGIITAHLEEVEE